MIFGHSRNFDLITQAKHRIDLIKKLDDLLDLIAHLLPCHKNVGVILCETPYPKQTVKRSREFVAVNQTQLTDTQRKLLVRVRFGTIYQHSAGTVHGFNCEICLIDNGCIHIVFIVLPMTRALPQGTIQHHRSRNLNITVSLVYFSPIFDQCIFQHHTFR